MMNSNELQVLRYGHNIYKTIVEARLRAEVFYIKLIELKKNKLLVVWETSLSMVQLWKTIIMGNDFLLLGKGNSIFKSIQLAESVISAIPFKRSKEDWQLLLLQQDNCSFSLFSSSKRSQNSHMILSASWILLQIIHLKADRDNNLKLCWYINHSMPQGSLREQNFKPKVLSFLYVWFIFLLLYGFLVVKQVTF